MYMYKCNIHYILFSIKNWLQKNTNIKSTNICTKSKEIYLKNNVFNFLLTFNLLIIIQLIKLFSQS